MRAEIVHAITTWRCHILELRARFKREFAAVVARSSLLCKICVRTIINVWRGD